MNLLEIVLFHDPRQHFSGTINPDFPKHKSLFSASENCGLPLGDLVSQILGNFYFHELDHFVKHTLKIRHYGRYMDDMIFLHEDRNVLTSLIPTIQNFLKNLGLTLHPDKILLTSTSTGFLFLGAYIKPWRTYISNRTKKNMYECIQNGNNIDPTTFQQQIQSYFGLMGHFDTFRLQEGCRIRILTRDF